MGRISGAVLNNGWVAGLCWIASTKTLAKLANHIAKENPEFNGVCDLNSLLVQLQDEWLSRIGVGGDMGHRATTGVQSQCYED